MDDFVKNPSKQEKHREWMEQWNMFQDNERFLFEEWISPATMESFRGKDVLECGCGGGQHTFFVAPIARSVTAVDLNTTEIARERNSGFKNVEFVEADIASMDMGKRFDIVFCVGVIHHTDDPDRTFESIYRHCKTGGLVIVWTYSAEGNELVRWFVEPTRKLFLRRLPRKLLYFIGYIITMILYLPVYVVYPFRIFSFLPYYEYFSNFRKLSLTRNILNVFDKLNAPQTKFTTLEKCHEWFSTNRFEPNSISIMRYKGVSYCMNGIKIEQASE